MASPSEFHDSETAAAYLAAEELRVDDDDGGGEEEEDDAEYVVFSPPSSRVSPDVHLSPNSDDSIEILDWDWEPQNYVEEDGNKRRRTEEGEASSSPTGGGQGNEFSDTDIDSFICPICFDVWTSGGEHQICCLPCGHIYGMSCINKWIRREGYGAKCPQCNKYFSSRDVRKLYVPRVIAVEEEVHKRITESSAIKKRIRSLEEKCAALESKDGQWNKKEAEWQKRVAALERKDGQWNKKEAEWQKKVAALERKDGDWRMKEAKWKERETALNIYVQRLKESNTFWRRQHQVMQNWQSEPMDCNLYSEQRYERERNRGPTSHEKIPFCNFECQNVLRVDGARLFDMDTSNDVLLIARKPKAFGGVHFLTKMSLISPFKMEDILLSSTTYAIRDLHISPSNSRLALYASEGKKLSVLSLDSSDIVVNYRLENPVWSCSWDLNSTNYIYAGLQNGSVMVFDLRQTSGPLKSLVGLTSYPVHTVQSLSQTSSLHSDARTILSASSSGICQWNIDSEDRPIVVPETDNQGECISLAYCSSSDNIVGSYRPKFDKSKDRPMFDMSEDVPLSKPLAPPSQVFEQRDRCSHVLYKGMGSHDFQKMGSTYANLCKDRLPKCAVIDMKNQGTFFASGDQFSRDLLLYELPSFRVVEQFGMPAQARDVRYSASHGVLGCLSDNTFRLFKRKENSENA